MPMTKAEKEEMEALRVRLALAWPPAPPPPVDVAIMKAATGQTWLRLWWINVASNSVGEGVTDGHLHSRDRWTDEQLAKRYDGGSRISMSQTKGGPWFATKEDAYKALIYGVAQECARRLYDVQQRRELDIP